MRLLETVKEEHPKAVKEVLNGLCSQWFSAFQQIMGGDVVADVTKSWEHLGILNEIFRVSSYPTLQVGQFQS
jgi:hypothetical protein